MSHAYDIQCFNCSDKFCDCHEAIYFDEEIFCSDECKDEYIEDHISCDTQTQCHHSEEFFKELKQWKEV